jgi:tRNA U34 2-thiouridine synthase MnmA/TrmU
MLATGTLDHRAPRVSADQVGHYARIYHQHRLEKHRLFRAKDKTKDQSYYLSGLSKAQITRVRVSSSCVSFSRLCKKELRS